MLLVVRIPNNNFLESMIYLFILVIYLFILVYLYWSGEYRKVWIWLRLTVVRSGDIVLSGVCLLLPFVHRNDVSTPTQNNNDNMSHSRFESFYDLCVATLRMFGKFMQRSSSHFLGFIDENKTGNNYHIINNLMRASIDYKDLDT